MVDLRVKGTCKGHCNSKWTYLQFKLCQLISFSRSVIVHEGRTLSYHSIYYFWKSMCSIMYADDWVTFSRYSDASVKCHNYHDWSAMTAMFAQCLPATRQNHFALTQDELSCGVLLLPQFQFNVEVRTIKLNKMN